MRVKRRGIRGEFPRMLFAIGLSHFSPPQGAGSCLQNICFADVAVRKEIKKMKMVRYTETFGENEEKLKGEMP